MPKETGKDRKAKKALKHSVPEGSGEAQSGGVPEETVENAKVKKSPQKLTTLANGEAAATPSPDSERKKKKKKKRKMANDAGPGMFLVFCFNVGHSGSFSAPGRFSLLCVRSIP